MQLFREQQHLPAGAWKRGDQRPGMLSFLCIQFSDCMSGRETSEMTGQPSSSRLLVVDALRGLIMIFMAVDHASFFVVKIHPSA